MAAGPGANILESYLVQLGFSVKKTELDQFLRVIRQVTGFVTAQDKILAANFLSLDKMHKRLTANFKQTSSALNTIQKNFQAFQGSAKQGADHITKIFKNVQVGIAGTITGLATGFAGWAYHIAMTERDLRFWARSMFLAVDDARTLKLATDALGVSIENMAWDKPTQERFREMVGHIQAFQKQLGPGYQEKMQRLETFFYKLRMLRIPLFFGQRMFLAGFVEKLGKAFGFAGEGLDKLMTDLENGKLDMWMDYLSTKAVQAIQWVWKTVKGLYTDIKAMKREIQTGEFWESWKLKAIDFFEPVTRYLKYFADLFGFLIGHITTFMKLMSGGPLDKLSAMSELRGDYGKFSAEHPWPPKPLEKAVGSGEEFTAPETSATRPILGQRMSPGMAGAIGGVNLSMGTGAETAGTGIAGRRAFYWTLAQQLAAQLNPDNPRLPSLIFQQIMLETGGGRSNWMWEHKSTLGIHEGFSKDDPGGWVQGFPDWASSQARSLQVLRSKKYAGILTAGTEVQYGEGLHPEGQPGWNPQTGHAYGIAMRDWAPLASHMPTNFTPGITGPLGTPVTIDRSIQNMPVNISINEPGIGAGRILEQFKKAVDQALAEQTGNDLAEQTR